MSNEDQTARREFYRVSVPEAEWVTLKTDSGDFRVREISENGIRLESNKEWEPEQWIRGQIEFEPGKSISVASQVLRCEENSKGGWIVVATVHNLLFAEVVSFQSSLVRRYGRDGINPNPSNEEQPVG